jgi:glycosyltransferase involved in cell wall biosynthesis
MPKVLHLTRTMDPNDGGIVDGIRQLNICFRAMGYETEVITLDHPDAPWTSTLSGELVVGGGPSSAHGSLAKVLPPLKYGFAPKFADLVRRAALASDIIIVHGLWNFVSVGALQGLRAAKRPYYIFPHGMLDPWFQQTQGVKRLAKQLVWWAADGRLFNGARAALFTTEDERSLAVGQFTPYRPNGVVVGFGATDHKDSASPERPAFLNAAPGVSGDRYLLFMGRIHPKKGCDILIQALGDAKDLSPIHLVMAGPDQVGWTAELKALAAQHGVADRVHWAGMVMGQDKHDLLRYADALILPSHQENFGVVVAEALSTSTPVLISNKVNVWREVAQFNAGLVEEDTREGAFKCIRDFLTLSDEQRREMSRRARQCYEQNFLMSGVVTRIVALHNDTGRPS